MQILHLQDLLDNPGLLVRLALQVNPEPMAKEESQEDLPQAHLRYPASLDNPENQACFFSHVCIAFCALISGALLYLQPFLMRQQMRAIFKVCGQKISESSFLICLL